MHISHRPSSKLCVRLGVLLRKGQTKNYCSCKHASQQSQMFFERLKVITIAITACTKQKEIIHKTLDVTFAFVSQW